LKNNSTPNYFSQSTVNPSSFGENQDYSYTPDYSMYAGDNPNYFSSNPSNAFSLGDLYTPPTSTASGFGGTGLDPSVGVAGYMPEEETPWWKGKLPQVSQGQADVFKGLAGLYSAYQGRNQANQLRQAAQQQDPFGAQRGQYQQLLSQSYANPNAFTSTPEARMQQDALRQQLERLDAKSGRRSQYGARAVQLAQAQAKQLADYRSGLQQAAGTGIAPSGAGLLQSQAAQAEMTAGGAPFQALSDIFTGQTPQYRAQAAENQKLKDSIALLTK